MGQLVLQLAMLKWEQGRCVTTTSKTPQSRFAVSSASCSSGHTRTCEQQHVKGKKLVLCSPPVQLVALTRLPHTSAVPALKQRLETRETRAKTPKITNIPIKIESCLLLRWLHYGVLTSQSVF